MSNLPGDGDGHGTPVLASHASSATADTSLGSPGRRTEQMALPLPTTAAIDELSSMQHGTSRGLLARNSRSRRSPTRTRDRTRITSPSRLYEGGRVVNGVGGCVR